MAKSRVGMNKTKKSVIKEDLNFLEYPNWIITEKEGLKEFKIEKENGIYKIATSSDTLPNRFDKIVLYYLLCKLFSGKVDSSEIITTRYKLAKNIFYKTKSVGKTEYERIMLSLERWAAIFIKFDGVFYDGDSYTKRYFHVIDDVVLNEEKRELYINFNEQYINQLKESNFCKFINFDEYKKLTKPTSARLYEILVKTFKDRGLWHISIIKLAEKLTLEKRKNIDTYYPSDILIKLRPAVNEINRKTELNVKLDYNKKTRICTFTKVKQARINKTEDKPKETSFPEDTNFKSLIVLIPKEHRDKKTILEAIASAYKKHGFDYVARNIKYTNRNCKGNYRAYLNKALKEDWGLAIQEDEESKQKVIKEQERKRQQEQEALKQQKELQSQARDYMDTLPQEELESLREEAIGRLDEEAKNSAEKFGKLEFIVRVGMEEIVGERLKVGECR